MDAVDVAANADAWILVGGADDDTTQFLYKIDNDATAATASGEVTLVATLTTNVTNGIAGYVVGDFDFTLT